MDEFDQEGVLLEEETYHSMDVEDDGNDDDDPSMQSIRTTMQC